MCMYENINHVPCTKLILISMLNQTLWYHCGRKKREVNIKMISKLVGSLCKWKIVKPNFLVVVFQSQFLHLEFKLTDAFVACFQLIA